MALVNSLVVDLVTKTIVLTSTSNALFVETISYSNITNQITFSARESITITAAEFLDLINQINIFQTCLNFNFPINLNATIPFGSVSNTESHDSNANTWGLVCIYGATPRLISYSALGANGTVNLLNRASSKTIDFPEWIRCFGALNLYKLSLKIFFNL